MTDHYATLGVAADAPQDEIKRAYRKLAMQFHPDKNPGNAEAEARFKDISSAYAEIGDEQSRANYDQKRQFGGPGSGFGFGAQGFEFNFNSGPGFNNINDVINQFFSQHGFGHQQQPRNRDLAFNLHMTLEEAFTGKQTPVQFSSGQHNYNIAVNVPAGIDNGARIRYAGHGDKSVPNAPPGDLYIQIQIAEHPVFKRSGPHLHANIEIDAISAMIGCTRDLRCIDGQMVNVKIPAGVQVGETIRLRERGMPTQAGGTHRGDCLINISVKVPKDLSDDHQQILREMLDKRTA